MKLCKTQIAQVILFLLATFLAVVPASAQAVPPSAQRGNIGIDVGEISDKFGGLSRSTDPAGDVNGEFIVLRGSEKNGWPNVIAGGDFRFPSDTSVHATEFGLYGGLEFRVTSTLSAGFHVGVRKLYVPPSTIDNQTFNRYNMELLETPLFVEYKFGPAKHVFVRAEGAPEFRPRFKVSSKGAPDLPNPNLDYGYFLRGSVGYNFGKWYARGGYETRYFKYTTSLGNPGGLNNWRTDLPSVGVGLNF